jgi:hypothetical protein
MLSRASRYQGRFRRSVRTLISLTMLALLAFFALWVISQLLLLASTLIVSWIIRPFDPRGDGSSFVKWPISGRTFFLKLPRPRPSKAFEFLDDWLSDPVHIRMIAYMTSGIGPRSHAYKLAEENTLWQLSSDSLKHEASCLSTRAEELERQAVEKANFSTLRQLVQCRRTTQKLQDGSKSLYRQMPSMSLDWECAMKDWNDGWHGPAERHSRKPYRERFPTFVSRVQMNPLESYYRRKQSNQPEDGEQTAELTLKDVEESLTRSMSLLQEAIAVQTSDHALWLALIATFYFPATLATGVFGMNLSLIDGKPYWWALVVCAILFIPNLAFLVYVFWRR